MVSLIVLFGVIMPTLVHGTPIELLRECYIDKSFYWGHCKMKEININVYQIDMILSMLPLL